MATICMKHANGAPVLSGAMLYLNIVTYTLETYVKDGIDLRGESFTVKLDDHGKTHILSKLHGEEILPSNSMVVISRNMASIDDTWHLQVYVDTDIIVDGGDPFVMVDEGHVRKIAA